MYRVFLVDDESDAREAIRGSVPWAELGMELAGEAADGEAALSMLREVRPDILITDVRMPRMDGLELCRWVCREMPDVRMAIVSAREEFACAQEALSLGVRAYLSKPVDAAELRAALARIAGELQERRDTNFPHRGMPALRAPEAQVLAQYDGPPLAELLKYVALSDMEAIVDRCAEVLSVARSERLNDHFFVDVILESCRIVRENQGDPREVIPEAFRARSEGEKVEDMLAFCREILRKAIAFRDSRGSARYGGVIRRAQAYIGERFSDSSLTLGDVAAHVALSNNHFCTIFSRETGMTFIEYLTSLRIQRAGELLRGTNMRTSEVAYAVGYNDPHYFSGLFKKNTGISPRDYRRNVGAAHGDGA